MNAGELGVAAFAISGIYAIWSDVTRRRLPNALCLLVALLGLLFSWQLGGWSAASNGLFHSVIALVVGIALFAGRVIGGGDAKYYAAVATWFGLDQAFRLLAWVSSVGFLLFLCWYLFRRLRGHPISKGANTDADKFPYGVAIALGGALLLYTNLH